MTVKVKKGSVGVKDGIAVSVTFVVNGVLSTRLILNKDGKIVEPPHSRFREDGKQARTFDDTDIPSADYRQMFFMAGGILGKPRKAQVR